MRIQFPTRVCASCETRKPQEVKSYWTLPLLTKFRLSNNSSSACGLLSLGCRKRQKLTICMIQRTPKPNTNDTPRPRARRNNYRSGGFFHFDCKHGCLGPSKLRRRTSHKTKLDLVSGAFISAPTKTLF
jgi:hypothetical protein